MRSKTGHVLPLLRAHLDASARGGLASVLLTQTFENPHDEVLSVVYALPLPADSVVSGFSFVLADLRITGEVDRRAQARARHARALREGRSAALVEQERSSLFTQEVGNIPPRSRITVEIVLDQRLRWLPEGAWEWRFPTVIAPRYRAQYGVQDHALAFSPEPLPPSLSLALLLDDPLAAPVTSPSHTLQSRTIAGQTQVSLSTPVRKDQDLVVRWPVCTDQVEARLAACRPEIEGDAPLAFGLLTLTPPAATVHTPALPRDLIVLLDISGSMAGTPLQQMKQVAVALLQSLGVDDQIEVLAFSDKVHRWRLDAVNASEALKSEAIAWVTGLQASGGTEMKAGIIQALAPLRPGAQRQVILMTDGLIDFEADVIKEVHTRLPAGSRVHALGIGGAVNRSLTAPLARAGAGVEQIVGLRESPQKAAERLVARTSMPLVVGLRLGGTALLAHAPARLPDLYAGAPALLSLKLRPEGGELWVEGDTPTGPWRRSLQVAPIAAGAGNHSLAALYAREQVEDLELAIAAGKPRREYNQQIEALGLAFQISTRLTSWIAISEAVTVEGATPRPIVIPQDLPDGLRHACSGFWPYRAFAHRRQPREQHQTVAAALRTRNVGITSVPDAGATTLADALVECADRAQSADDGALDPFMDCMESERGIYIEPVASTCEWDDHGLTLVGTPRHPRTSYEAECIRDATDSTILVFDAVTGATPRSARQAVADGVPSLVFINKLDRPGSDEQPVLSRLHEVLGRTPLRLQLPIKVDDDLVGLIDLVERRAYHFDVAAYTTREGPIPAELMDAVEHHRRALLEALSDGDDEALAAFLDGRALDDLQLKASIRRLCLACLATPVLLGAAVRQRGMEALLAGIIAYLPGPGERVREAIDGERGTITLESADERPFVARVFSVRAMLRSRLAYLRIYQGCIHPGDEVQHGATALRSRITGLLRAHPHQEISLEQAHAGDIVALRGVDCVLGETLTDGRVRCTMRSSPLPEAVLAVTVTATDKRARARLQPALIQLTQADPALRVRPCEDPYQATLVGLDELHLAINLDRLRREYQCVFTAGPLQVERQGGLAPLMEVMVVVPDALQASVMIQLSRRHGLLTNVTSDGEETSVTAEIVLDDLLGYDEELRGSSRDQGSLTTRFLRYAPRPSFS